MKCVYLTLRGCLYAPMAPINLLSVGALAERGLCCLFSPGGTTKIFYPDDHPRLPVFSLSASVVNRLSFLTSNLTFIPPAVSLVSALSSSFSSFLSLLLSPNCSGFYALASSFWSYWYGSYSCNVDQELCHGCSIGGFFYS